MKDFLFRWFLVVAWMGVIFSFSNMPVVINGNFELLDFITKKGAHVAEYLILYLLLARAGYRQIGLNGAFLVAIFYAFTDESHQLLVPGRTGKLTDVLFFDFLGITLGYVATLKFKKLWK
jgi:VanZ family protein